MAADQPSLIELSSCNSIFRDYLQKASSLKYRIFKLKSTTLVSQAGARMKKYFS